MKCLRDLNLKDNHVNKAQKYREQIIMSSRCLNNLDGKTIRDQERRYLFALAQKMSEKHSKSLYNSGSTPSNMNNTGMNISNKYGRAKSLDRR